MSKRGISILLLLTAAIVIGALVQDYRFDGWLHGQRAAASALDVAQTAERQAIEANIAWLSRLRLGMNAAALLFALAVVLFFGRHVAGLADRAAPTTAQMLKDLPPPVKAGTSATQATTSSASSSPPIAPAPAHPHATPAVASRPANLLAAAELCVDLARVVESSEVPALLERTAALLDARGLVIWAVDSDGARLRPALSHGYADKVLQKLRPLQIDGDNVTSLAFRSLEPQSMNGASPNDPAAIAIPLLTGTGCVGVMAAELRHNRPHADVLPVARILGAQFSTLVATPDEPIRRTAQA